MYLTELLSQNAVIQEQILVVVSGKMFVRALKLLVIDLADTGFPKCQWNSIGLVLKEQGGLGRDWLSVRSSDNRKITLWGIGRIQCCNFEQRGFFKVQEGSLVSPCISHEVTDALFDSLPQVRIRYIEQCMVLFTKIHVRAEFLLAVAARVKAPPGASSWWRVGWGGLGAAAGGLRPVERKLQFSDVTLA